MTGYSDTLLIVTVLAVPKGVTLNGHPCTEIKIRPPESERASRTFHNLRGSWNSVLPAWKYREWGSSCAVTAVTRLFPVLCYFRYCHCQTTFAQE